MEKLYNEETEKHLIGCMLVDNSIIDDVCLSLKKDFFFVAKYQLFFEKIVGLYEDNQKCDLMMLCDSLPSMYTAEIADITSTIETVSTYEYYVKQIKAMYKARRVKSFSAELQSEVTSKNVDDMLYKADDFVNNCLTDMSKLKPFNGKEMTIRAVEMIQERKNHIGELTGIDTGYEKLNQFTDGFHDGNLVAIGARSSLGKSALSDQLCCNIASKGVSTVTFSLEMTADEIGERRASVMSGIPIKKLRSGMLTGKDCEKINSSLSKLFDFGDNLILYDSNSVSCEFTDIVSKIRIHAKQGAKVFFIDHIGLVDCEEMKGCPEWERIAYMTKRLKQLANKLKIVIVIVCQLGRDAEGKEPQLNQIRGSGSIEQDCNTVILIHRERQKADENIIPTTVKVLKCRGGSCGDIEFNFYPHTVKFEEVVHKSVYEQSMVVEVAGEKEKGLF